MADARLQVIIEAVDRASAVINQVGATIQQHRSELMKAGAALSAFGALGAGALFLVTRAAQEQETSIRLLDQALRNAGTSYEDHRVAIEAVLEAQQRQTSFGDTQQREALQLLVLVLKVV